MDLTLNPNTPAPLEAPTYALLLASIICWKCHATTPTAAVWVPSFVEIDEEGEREEGDAALLRYIQALNVGALKHVEDVAPWLKLARTQMAGISYLANHCSTCGTVQGDHFVFEPDGPYWPQDDAALARLEVVAGVGSLRAAASAAQSAWMQRVRVTP